MFTLITLSFSIFFISLTGWILTTYLFKENSQKLIREELNNLFDISKMFFISLKSLIGVLAKFSFSSDSSEIKPKQSNGLEEALLKFIQPVEAPSSDGPVKEDEDTELSSFSPEVIEIIKEEEEKVA